MLIAAKSDIGLIREKNEDYYALSAPELCVVADGMGGHAAGEVASRLAVETLLNNIPTNVSFDQSLAILEQQFQLANQAVFEKARANPEFYGMGTTLTAITIKGNAVHCAHVGDSRLYKFHHGQLIQLTADHSLVAELIRSGMLTPAEARVHPQRNMLTRAIGTSEQVQVDLNEFFWSKGDLLLLCTDGLTGMLDDNTIIEILKNDHLSLDVRLQSLITAANAAGGQDNITVILLENSDVSVV